MSGSASPWKEEKDIAAWIWLQYEHEQSDD